jgi:hypothetical protein
MSGSSLSLGRGMAGAVMFYRITFPFERLCKGPQRVFGRIIAAREGPDFELFPWPTGQAATKPV